jgi:hypothetical protein
VKYFTLDRAAHRKYRLRRLRRQPLQKPRDLCPMPATAPARGTDAAGIECFGNSVQARYAGGMELGDDRSYVGGPSSGDRYAGSRCGLVSVGRKAVTSRHGARVA